MARDIFIIPNRGSTTSGQYPEIQFNGASASTISLKVDDDGSVKYTGDNGTLFNITDSKEGLLHSVSDISGLPILQVWSDDRVIMGRWDKNALVVNSDKVGIGLTAPSTKLHIYGTSSGIFRLQDGSQASGYIMISDTNGVATWTASSNVFTQTGNGVTASGTASYISKFTGTNTLGNSQIYDNGTNIGINNTSPSYKLDISGETRIVSNTSTAFQVGNGPSNIHLSYDGTTGATTFYKIISQNFFTQTDGTTKINGSSLGFQNDAYILSYQKPLYLIRSYPQFGTQSGFIFDNDASGGGTASPTYRIIDLKSDGVSRNYFTPTKAYFTQILEQGDPSDGRIFFRVSTSGKQILTDYEFNTSTDIGNNGATVSTRLFVGSNLDTANAIVLNGGGGGGGNYGQNAIYFADTRKSLAAIKALSGSPFTYADLAFYTTPNTDTTTLVERMRITKDGLIGVGVSSPNYKLEVSGTVSTTGFRMTNGASNGYYLQSDSNGNATWAPSTGNGVTASGTTNTIAKFTGSNILGDSLITDNGSTVTIAGNLTVTGTSTTVNTVNLTVQDPIILLSSTQSGSPILDSGIMVRRGTGATQAMIWDESADEFVFISTNDGDNVIGNVSITSYSPLKSGDYIIIGSGTTSASSGFTVRDSSSNELFKVRNDGRVFIKGTMGIGYGNDPNNSKLNVAIGENALQSYNGAYGTGADIAVGTDALRSTTTGQYNVGVGHQALYSNTTGNRNIAFNRSLLNNISGSYNIGIGDAVLNANTASSYNIGIGDNALQALTSGSYNIAMGGYAALYALTTGSNNIALGYFSGVYMSTGSANTIVGHSSLSSNPFSGSNNTIFGGSNLTTLITGDANTVIGRNIQSWTSSLSNNILIGDGSGNIRMMSDSTGKVGIGLTGPTAKLHVKGNTSSTVFKVDGTSGELFSITDSLVGSLFSVNDISGLPVLEAFSDNTVLLGDYAAPALFTTTKITTTQSQTDIYSIATASYTGAYYDYTIVNGSNARSGSIQAIWLAGTLQYNEVSTLDIGTTSGFTFSVVASGTYSVLRSNASSNGWVVKTIIRSI